MSVPPDAVIWLSAALMRTFPAPFVVSEARAAVTLFAVPPLLMVTVFLFTSAAKEAASSAPTCSMDAPFRSPFCVPCVPITTAFSFAV